MAPIVGIVVDWRVGWVDACEEGRNGGLLFRRLELTLADMRHVDLMCRDVLWYGSTKNRARMQRNYAVGYLTVWLVQSEVAVKSYG